MFKQHVNTPRYAKDAATKQYVDTAFANVQPGASSSVFDYRLDATSTGPSDPGAGKYRYSATPQNAAETLYMDWLTQDGFDVVALFTSMKFGDEFIIQDKDLSLNYQKWKLLGPAQIMPDWFQIPVQFIEGDAVFSNNQLVSFVVTFVGQEGEPGPMGPQGPTGAQGATGPAGPGVPPSGNAGQILSKINGVDYNTQWINPPTGDVTKAYTDAQDALRVLKTGDVMTGSLSIRDSTIFLDKTVASNYDLIYGTLNGVVRWRMDVADGAAESGGNRGSNFIIHRFADNGDYLGPPLSIDRRTGTVNFEVAPTVAGLPISAGGSYLPLAGGTLTGNLTISKDNPSIFLNKTGTVGPQIFGQLNGVNRWHMTLGNAAGDYVVTRYNDAGAFVANALAINRLTGSVGVGTATPGYLIDVAPATLKNHLTVFNDTDRGLLELASSVATGSTVAGQIAFVDTSIANVMDRQLVGILGLAVGTAGNRGGEFRLYVKADNGAVYERLSISNAGIITFTGNMTLTGVLSVNSTINALAKGHQFGGASGIGMGSAVAATDANIKMYDNGGGNWCGFGTDSSGHYWIRTGLSGTPVPAFIVMNDGQVRVRDEPTDVKGVATKAYVDSKVGGGPFLPLAGGQMTGRIGLSGYGLAITQAGDITQRINSGFYENSATSLATGWPTASGWCHLIAATHSNDANYYSMQLAMSFAGSSQQLYFRNTDGNGATGWRTVWDNASINKGNLGLVTHFNDGPGAGAWYSVPSVSNNRFYVGTEGATDEWRIYSTGGGNVFKVHGWDSTVVMPGWIQVGNIDCAGNVWVKGGVLYLSGGGHYFQWDGANYQMPHGGLIIQGNWAARQNTDNTFNNITCNGAVDAVNMYYGRLGQGGARSNTFSIYWDGRAWCMIDSSNMGQFSGVSDYRAKKDVENMKSMWDNVKKLRPISFKFNDWMPEWELETQTKRAEEEGREVRPFIVGSNMTEWGFIAHELQEALIPTVASGYKDIQKAVQVPNPLPLIAMTVKALQEAIARIEIIEGKLQ